MKVRQLGATPPIRNSSTSATAGHFRTEAEKVVWLRTESTRLVADIRNVPEDTNSRLDWISQQLRRD